MIFRVLLVGVGVGLCFLSSSAQAFCGFYVAGADAKLFNNATQVVLMRQGSRTVLSMQNNYQGPPEDFALVVPVPEVLNKDRVKTLRPEIFERVDQLAAPRLVEYWEQDPCQPVVMRGRGFGLGRVKSKRSRRMAAPASADLGVTIEAQFDVGEYQIVILSAKDSLGLETWLRQENYRIPNGAAKVLTPYVQQGMKFFVAKVNASKVKFENGQAQLSPLRFHFDSKKFSLPVRLGLLNSKGQQDLLVHILAKNQRYELANYDNVTIPTNLDVKSRAKAEFGAFYTALFDETVRQNPRAVITEYSWSSASCDPCPTPPLSASDILTLGGDVLGNSNPNARRRFGGNDYVLTRLHARYSKDTLGEDLVFRTAPPISGGRETSFGKQANEQGAQLASMNNFQARYAVRHAWSGPVACENPVRGRWGGPPGGDKPKPLAARKLAFASRNASLGDFAETRVLASMKTLVTTNSPVGGGKPIIPGGGQEKTLAPPGSANPVSPKKLAAPPVGTKKHASAPPSPGRESRQLPKPQASSSCSVSLPGSAQNNKVPAPLNLAALLLVLGWLRRRPS